MEKIKILIADDVEDIINVVKKTLSLEEDTFEVVGQAGNGQEALDLIPKVHPDIVLMDINMPVLNGLEATEKITKDYPNVAVIMMSVQGEAEYLKKAMFHGAKEFIIKPFNYEGLVETIKTTHERHREMQKTGSHREEKEREGKLLTYFSSKGGVGKSILSLNTAIALSQEKKQKVLLMDLDLQFNDISILVNKYNERTILDLVDEGQLNTYQEIKPYLYAFNENLDMLFAPGKPEAAEYISKSSIEKIIKALKHKYDLIIVDTGINFNDNTLYVLDHAEQIFFVSTMEIASLKNTKLGMNVMESLGYDQNKVKLIINRFTTKFGVSKGDVEDVFKDGIYAMIPDDEKTVSLSVNRGEPFAGKGRLGKSKVEKAIEAMCISILE